MSGIRPGEERDRGRDVLVLAYLTEPNAVRAMVEHLALPPRPAAADCSAGATWVGVYPMGPHRAQPREGACWRRWCARA